MPATTTFQNYAQDEQQSQNLGALDPTQVRMPQDSDAEKSILSAMLLSDDVLQECLMRLRVDDFYLQSHKMIFNAICALAEQGHQADPISVADYLKTQNQLDKIGGSSTLLELNENTFSLTSWEHHIEILRRNATLRAIIHASANIQKLAFRAPEDTKEVVDSAENMLLDVTNKEVTSNFSQLSDLMADLYNDLSDMQEKGKPQGVYTDYPTVDRWLQGLRPGQMIVVGARPGVGKTSFALNLAVNMANSGASVAFFSLEMSKIEIAQRLLSAQAKIDLSVIRGGNIQANQWAPIMAATADLSKLDIMVDDTPGTTVTEIRAKARRMLNNKENSVVIIDYLQLLSPPSGRYRADSRATEVSEMSRGIKIMAKNLNVPVVALSQLNRQVTGRRDQKPQLSDLRESGSIEQDADIVILLDRSMTDEEAERQDRPDRGETSLIIAKNRSGPVGVVSLRFLPGTTKFLEIDKSHEE
ncbi:replicative DNA helicase [Fannyhessea vaginae]|uniref:replicative DNA helicase n=1 Tax=Fannyhessea vaginae TaxID=82135 RepID=UPI00076FC8FD|nr:replicative DNA helicase [Fannyhessea vaginae]KXG88530.1 replicative DNA helicase [Fannyhessea vaginae]